MVNNSKWLNDWIVDDVLAEKNCWFFVVVMKHEPTNDARSSVQFTSTTRIHKYTQDKHKYT